MEVRPARTQEEVAAALTLREQVFSGEQGVSVESDRDGRDGEATHVVAIQDSEVIGTCRLVYDGTTAKLGRMVVERALRGRGVGAAILREAEREARAAGASRIALHAQTRAKALYARGGFVEWGSEFVEEGIPHVSMEKRLA
jgi:predicted GNAT family N-acyltransferase